MIGQRVADAITLKDDMQLVGIADIGFYYRIRIAAERNYPIYTSLPDKRTAMVKAGIPVAGVLDDLLGKIDLVVYFTPKGIGAKNKDIYEKAGIKDIFQGGEKHEIAGTSFTAQVNYG